MLVAGPVDQVPVEEAYAYAGPSTLAMRPDERRMPSASVFERRTRVAPARGQAGERRSRRSRSGCSTKRRERRASRRTSGPGAAPPGPAGPSSSPETVRAGEVEAQRADDLVERGLQHVPFVEAVLLHRQAEVDGGHVRGGGGGELRAQRRDLRAAPRSGWPSWRLQEPQPEGVEQEQRHALAVGHAAADLVGDVGERAVRPHAQNRHAFVCGPSQIRLVSSQGPGLAWFSVRRPTYRDGFKRAETRNWSEHEREREKRNRRRV